MEWRKGAIPTGGEMWHIMRLAWSVPGGIEIMLPESAEGGEYTVCAAGAVGLPHGAVAVPLTAEPSTGLYAFSRSMPGHCSLERELRRGCFIVGVKTLKLKYSKGLAQREKHQYGPETKFWVKQHYARVGAVQRGLTGESAPAVTA